MFRWNISFGLVVITLIFGNSPEILYSVHKHNALRRNKQTAMQYYSFDIHQRLNIIPIFRK